MRVLVTGATGLLGSRLMNAFPADWDVVGACHSAPAPGMVELELESVHSVLRVLQSGRYDWVVHCAATRSPDACERDPRRAMAVNAQGTEYVARAASRAGSRMVFASTDYVFPGDDPPYSEEDPPAPLNVYGHSKLAGEQRALAVPGALVVRMPALYSLDLTAPNNVLNDLRTRLSAGQEAAGDDTYVRYYTLAEDVARAIAFLMTSRRRGIYHVSSDLRSTKLQFLRRAARVLGLDSSLVVEAEPSDDGAARPADSHLDAGLYRSLSGPGFMRYDAALGQIRAA
jgi:dTDP-4-dehydrorhamnose reductase